MIIEEFMLLANEAAANYARIKEVPLFIEFMRNLILKRLRNLKRYYKNRVSYPIVDSFKPAHLAQILDNARESPMFL